MGELHRVSNKIECKCGNIIIIYSLDNDDLSNSYEKINAICKRCYNEIEITVINSETSTISGGVIVR